MVQLLIVLSRIISAIDSSPAVCQPRGEAVRDNSKAVRSLFGMLMVTKAWAVLSVEWILSIVIVLLLIV